MQQLSGVIDENNKANGSTADNGSNAGRRGGSRSSTRDDDHLIREEIRKIDAGRNAGLGEWADSAEGRLKRESQGQLTKAIAAAVLDTSREARGEDAESSTFLLQHTKSCR